MGVEKDFKELKTEGVTSICILIIYVVFRIATSGFDKEMKESIYFELELFQNIPDVKAESKIVG